MLPDEQSAESTIASTIELHGGGNVEKQSGPPCI
jgi:hypothetical protein